MHWWCNTCATDVSPSEVGWILGIGFESWLHLNGDLMWVFLCNPNQIIISGGKVCVCVCVSVMFVCSYSVDGIGSYIQIYTFTKQIWYDVALLNGCQSYELLLPKQTTTKQKKNTCVPQFWRLTEHFVYSRNRSPWNFYVLLSLMFEHCACSFWYRVWAWMSRAVWLGIKYWSLIHCEGLTVLAEAFQASHLGKIAEIHRKGSRCFRGKLTCFSLIWMTA